VTKEEWDQYWEKWKALLRAMNDTQNHAASLKATLQKKITSSNKALQRMADSHR